MFDQFNYLAIEWNSFFLTIYSILTQNNFPYLISKIKGTEQLKLLIRSLLYYYYYYLSLFQINYAYAYSVLPFALLLITSHILCSYVIDVYWPFNMFRNTNINILQVMHNTYSLLLILSTLSYSPTTIKSIILVIETGLQLACFHRFGNA